MENVFKKKLKENILNLTAKLGNRTLAIKRLNLDFTTYRSLCKEDKEFYDDLNEAESYFVSSMNDALRAIAKRKLLEMITEGTSELHTTTKYLEDPENPEKQLRQTVIKRVHKGAPMAAIVQALNIVPDISKATETFVDAHVIPANRLQAIAKHDQNQQKQLLEVIFGEEKQVLKLTDEMISSMQRKLVGTIELEDDEKDSE